MTGPHEVVEDRLRELVQRLKPLRPTRILLFGSAAQGRVDAMSDLDVIVVAENTPERFLDRLERAYELIDPHYALDILVYTPDEYERMVDSGNPLIERAEAEGRLLYARRAS